MEASRSMLSKLGLEYRLAGALRQAGGSSPIEDIASASGSNCPWPADFRIRVGDDILCIAEQKLDRFPVGPDRRGCRR